MFQTRLALYASPVVGARVATARIPDGLFWDTQDPYRYLRLARPRHRRACGSAARTGRRIRTIELGVVLGVFSVRMCTFAHDHQQPRYGFLVDTPEIRALVDATNHLRQTIADDAARVEALRPAFAALLAAEGWLPDSCAQPDETSKMGGGIGQYALYRAEDGSLCLFSLVVPVGASTPVHDHLAWGLVGIYRGRQDETVYRRLDDGSDPARAQLEIAKRQELGRGEFYALLPPADDIHYVSTVSDTASVSIHLLANDTACVWRHRFEPATGVVTPFRSGYANAPCPPEGAGG